MRLNDPFYIQSQDPFLGIMSFFMILYGTIRCASFAEKIGRETSEFRSAAGIAGPPRILLARRNLASNAKDVVAKHGAIGSSCLLNPRKS